jgi:hypothetical protein
MVRRGGAIGEALAGARTALDQRRARPVVSEQVDRLEGAGKAAADDGDVRARVQIT